MLVNLTNTLFEQLSKQKQAELTDLYGTLLDLQFPKNSLNTNIEQLAEDYFIRTAAALDACANEPKQKAVLMNNKTELELLLKKYFEQSKIKVILWT